MVARAAAGPMADLVHLRPPTAAVRTAAALIAAADRTAVAVAMADRVALLAVAVVVAD